MAPLTPGRGTSPSRARSHGRGARPYPRADGARPEPLRARRLLAALVGALRLQALGPPAQAVPERGRARAPGAGRERRRARPRRRRGGRVQGRVAQPSDRGRAVPGRGHRRRRDPPRHRRDGRAAGRAARRAALRRARLRVRPRGRGNRRTTATASASRPSAARRSSTRATRTTASSTRCASGCSRPTASRARRRSTPGHLLVLYGATTGRDGIGGASVLASQELGEGAAEKRPSVQIGDPFTGKKLIEVSVELVERGLVESLQDCGAAGLASALAEMARDGAGVDVHLDRVPLREELEPWEIMISETPGADGRGRPARRSSTRSRRSATAGSSHCTPIGEVTDTGELRAFHDGESVGEIPRELPHRRGAALRGRADAARGRARAACARRAAASSRRCSSCSRSPNIRSRRVDLRALRPPRRLAHGPPARARRGGAAAAPVAARARRLARRAGPDRRARRRAPAGRWPCSRRRGTSPAPAASRSG